jgi:hypothetical protein
MTYYQAAQASRPPAAAGSVVRKARKGVMVAEMEPINSEDLRYV